MPINRSTFFVYARRAPFGGRLTQSQVDGMNAILDEWDARRLSDLRWLAYLLATPFHETGGKMVPNTENLNYSSAARIRQVWPSRFPTTASAQPYVNNPRGLANKVYGERMGNTGKDDGWTYRGRGLPHLTGKVNYRKASGSIGVDLVANPERALELPIAVKVLFDGMIEGWFTGHKLESYFNATTDDPEEARRIINALDKSKLIAGYHRNLLAALQAADEASPQPTDAPPALATPDDIRPAESKSLWSALITFATGGGGLAFLGAIDNPMALAAFALVLIAGGIGVWLVITGRVTFNRSALL